MKNKKSKKMDVIKNMPPLYHTIPGQPFDIKKSIVVQWLIIQPDLLNYLWDQIKQSGYLIYNPETGKWQGIDYDN